MAVFTGICSFEAFSRSKEFQKLLDSRKNSAPGRLSRLLSVIYGRIQMEIPLYLLIVTANKMCSEHYKKVERSFYMVPTDLEGYAVFEKLFIAVCEQNQSFANHYLEFFLSDEYIALKKSYRENLDLYTNVLKRLTDLLITVKDPTQLRTAAKLFSSEHASAFLFIAKDVGQDSFFVNLYIFPFLNGYPPEMFFQCIKLFFIHYNVRKLNKSGKEKVFQRLLGVINLFVLFNEDEYGYFKNFLKSFGDMNSDFERFVWEQVLSLDLDKMLKVMMLFSATSFQELNKFHAGDKETLKFIIKNIITALAESEIRKLNSSIYKLILKLLLNLKVNREFLKRRAAFFHLLKKMTSSIRIELEVIRYIFFEYIYIATGLVKNTYYMEFTKFCDPGHKFFCEVVDRHLKEKWKTTHIERMEIAAKLVDKIRSVVWKDAELKFKNSYHFQQVQSMAVSANLEDQAILNLGSVEVDDLLPYYTSLMEVFKTHPENMVQAIQSDYWYRLPLDTAMPHLFSAVLPLVGTVEILEGQSGAYTNGRTIFLPAYVNEFKDPLDPLENNRNLTFYMGLALHEAAHILAGSFQFNLVYYLAKLENPQLFQILYNCFEDYRIEAFLRKIHAHPQIDAILFFINETSSLKFLVFRPQNFLMFFCFMTGEAAGEDKNLKELEKYKTIHAELLGLNVNTGRFRSLRDLYDYGVERLKNLDINNPLAVYPLAKEMYEICKHWQEAVWMEPEKQSDSPKGNHHRVGELEVMRPLSEENLVDMYKEYNENPGKFLIEHQLGEYSALVSGEEDVLGRNEGKYIDELAEQDVEMSYEDRGTIDFSHRTKADNLSAESKSFNSKMDSPKNVIRKRSRKSKKVVKKKKKYIYSIDPKTKSRTNMSEIEEYTITRINTKFLKYMKRWDFISQKVYRMLSVILPTLSENHELSASDGDLNMEILTETLSDKNKVGIAEIFDIYIESRREMEIIIGLDASGSTNREIEKGFTIFDLEKTFAIILANAVKYLTNNVRVYCFDSMTSTNIYKASTINAVSAFQVGNSNRDGDFVRYITAELCQSRSEIRYFFMISDGMPCANNYYGKEAMDDTLISFRECRNEGIKLIYFNIDSERQDYFEAFKKEATYAEYFRHPEDLLPAIPDIVKTLALSAM